MFLHLFIYCTYVHARVQALWHECGGLKIAPGSQVSPVTMQFPGMELLGFSGNHLASPKIVFSSLFLTSLLSPSPPPHFFLLSVAVRGPPEVLVTGFPFVWHCCQAAGPVNFLEFCIFFSSSCCWALGSETHTVMPGFPWALGFVPSQVFCLWPLSHLPNSLILTCFHSFIQSSSNSAV